MLPIIPIFSVLAGYFLVYKLSLRIYRVYFHPLKHFRGPAQACVSDNWLYEVSKGGKAEDVFEKLHKDHNTKALRIGPNELHLTDVDLYKTIYSQTSPFSKDADFYDAFNTPHTAFAETDPARHKERRRLLNPTVSRSAVLRLEGVIREKLFMLANKIDPVSDTRPIEGYSAFRLLTTDIIMQFAFGRTTGMLDGKSENFSSSYLEAFENAFEAIAEFRYRPWLRHLSNAVPKSLIALLNPTIEALMELRQYGADSLEEYKKKHTPPPHPVIFDALSSIPDDQKVAQAMDILIAGADTTASTLTAGLYHILKNPQVKADLVRALDAALPPEKDSQLPSLVALEKVEYLTACVKESLRLAMTIPGRLPRVVPENLSPPLMVDRQVIPAGTTVSISVHTMHYNTEIWGSDARAFNPGRWLGPNKKELETYFVPFSRGARMCLGQNLALAEITMTLGFLFLNYEVGLVDKEAVPGSVDRFTVHFTEPGVLVEMARRGGVV
ncbi:cytochrome P450 [Aspergillus karnatakaensis]|uniref:cytochrome P450 n=1 Tax=Aspergillus karnatakaensis TaxID=1810916 RepID=UPI003CCCA5B1